MRHLVALAAIFLLAMTVGAQSVWQPQVSGTTARLRGVSAVSEKIAWASGSGGTVVRTIDGGATWEALPVPDASDLDFRDVEAFDAKTAYILSIGAGDKSRIYRTSDGGRSWFLQFTNGDPKAFYDAVAFWDAKSGLAIGDPVDERFTVIRTLDGGRTWLPVPAEGMPRALTGESAFAASGTCLVVGGRTDAWFGTGGAEKARVFHSADRGVTWKVADTPLTAAGASAGIFSIAFSDGADGVAVGGDYRKEREPGDNLALSSDGGASWVFPGVARLRGFRSAVAFVPGTRWNSLIAVGPAGAERSDDGGRSWTPIGTAGFHAVSVERTGRVAWAVGEQGSIARLALRMP